MHSYHASSILTLVTSLLWPSASISWCAAEELLGMMVYATNEKCSLV